MSTNGNKPELVNILIDGKPVSVPKGTNLIEAARSIGIEIPHYCYHPHLSIAGNCRMCQVEVKGAPKMEIACNTVVKEGMEVLTQEASAKAKDAQAATLEFILINHPLDCTVCDQAGHCKLQDYHYEYNARPSRFLEDKVHKVKAEPLGPTVILDGERCIMCTRCIRFCDEVTGTSELGMLNRGDRSVIAINPGRELNNPLSGTVVDLCPVGALTHRDWRFNTRIWFTKQVDTICPGCSTGCNAKAAVRDQQVVQVKARMNDKVNKEWMCDEGRYGFHRFLPEKRIISPLVEGKAVSREEALKAVKWLAGDDLLVLLSPDLMLEDYVRIQGFLDKSFKSYTSAVAYREGKLTTVEPLLISPDYAYNFRGAVFE
ncbi:MAG: (2Fe-2S)-binding protein, partial [Deltaproteobacteria bacterium]|nr:(2Fe-2S)-binding protein [Deltaproteobacteria bacterium]